LKLKIKVLNLLVDIFATSLTLISLGFFENGQTCLHRKSPP